jgi:hypothetical protein
MLPQRLKAAGVRVWRDTAGLWPGVDWRVKIWDAITHDALVSIACFSSCSGLRAGWLCHAVACRWRPHRSRDRPRVHLLGA